MPEDSGVRRTPEQTAAAGPRRLASPIRSERAVLMLRGAGPIDAQISRLAGLRVRLRRGARAEDDGSWPRGTLATRRLEGRGSGAFGGREALLFPPALPRGSLRSSAGCTPKRRCRGDGNRSAEEHTG
jgi:hypothetical protein